MSDEITPEHREQMNKLARFIDAHFNEPGKKRDVGFVLLLFPYGVHDDAHINYISNGADRKDITTLFKEMIARFEGQARDKGNA